MVKIDGIEIKDHKTTFMTGFIIALIAFSTGVLAYHYMFMILPSRPGCVQISVKDAGGKAMKGVTVQIYIAVYGETGDKVAEGITDTGGKLKFCDKFEPNEIYAVNVYDQTGNNLWSGLFSTNEKSTADFPVIIKQENT
ncbi:MAG: hypothetical protein GTN36_04905 [Candidatus Aenigmarchaeota archaeon]|nr:hypothetical protein [Candidatus Aenigmarchaeota archaeon]